ncbi:MAG: LysM peptidoglycan-binding domain-containing protein [Solirubrobacterales bacterium]|nr:LysM peptidoglycan-binding domain-containing protein [Solirubrobacterales bacterium]
MTKTSPIARILAAVALLGAIALVFVVLSNSTGTDDNSGKDKANQAGKKQGADKKAKPKSKSKIYVIQNGDTLTGIAVETGVEVTVIQRLNPDLDPQALIAGQKLKLR